MKTLKAITLVAVAGLVMCGCVSGKGYLVDFGPGMAKVRVPWTLIGPGPKNSRIAADKVAAEQCGRELGTPELAAPVEHKTTQRQWIGGTLTETAGERIYLYRCVGGY